MATLRSRIAFGCALLAGTAVLGCGPAPEDAAADLEPVGETAQAQTVGQSVSGNCSTAAVQGLALQIIAQAACSNPDAFVEVPAVGNIVFTPDDFPFLEAPAQQALLAALASAPDKTLHINSMLRALPQQYLLYHWYLNDQACGIKKALPPGDSNHETGLAMDVYEYQSWQPMLEANGFHWFGYTDEVHYDYAGPGATNYKGADVLAFQQLWNFNNPGDVIDEDGAYGPQTEARLQQSPGEGFPTVPTCGASKTADLYPSARFADADDRFDDGLSKGVPDLFEGDAYEIELVVENQGGAGAENVDVGVALDGGAFVATDYLIETDYQHEGTFTVNDANDLAENPAHGATLEPTFGLKLNAMSPGETKRITLTVEAIGYSVTNAAPPEVHFWVVDVPGLYHQDDYGGASDNTDDSQTFGGGKLEVAAGADVYSHTRWEWDTDRLEGWTPRAGATLEVDEAGKAASLDAEAGADDPGMLGPETDFDAALGAVYLRAKRTGGTGGGRLYFATAADPEMDEAKSVGFELPDDGAFHEIAIDLSGSSAYAGTVVGLRLDPFERGPGTFEIDWLRIGSPEPPDPPGGRGTGSRASEGDAVEGGCACVAASSAPSSRAPWGAGLAAAALGIFAARRRRRVAPSGLLPRIG